MMHFSGLQLLQGEAGCGQWLGDIKKEVEGKGIHAILAGPEHQN